MERHSARHPSLQAGSEPAAPASAHADPDELTEVTPEVFSEGFGEDIYHTLDVDTWQTGEDLSAIYSRIEHEVREAVRQEEEHRRTIRRLVFPRLADYAGAPKGAGVYPLDRAYLERVHWGLLFNGGTEAADGTLLSHDSLPLTIFQIGVSLVSYQGHQGTWSHRLFRRDLRVSGGDPTQEAIKLLERREIRDALNHPGRRDALSRLARLGIMSYAERAILLRCSKAAWRMGHGNPAPFELVTGSGSLDLMVESTRLIRELIEQHQKFVFVASEPRDRFLLTVGQALRPLEYAIVRSLRDVIYWTVEHGVRRGRTTADTTWDGQRLTPEQWLLRFRDEVTSQVVVGVYRATRMAPPQVFYAHQDHADIAAHIAIADSVLQEHRGFPLLIDLADNVCRGVFGRDTLEGPVTTAYADARAPFRYLSERQTRYQ
jgi:hypothetical protein